MNKSPANIYEIFIYNHRDKLLYYEDFSKPSEAPLIDLETLDKTAIHRVKNISGIAQALRNVVEKLSPTPILSFKNIVTNKFKYNIYELPTGLKFVLITAVDTIDYTETLQRIYYEAYVDIVKKNVLYKVDSTIDNSLFRAKVKEILFSVAIDK